MKTLVWTEVGSSGTDPPEGVGYPQGEVTVAYDGPPAQIGGCRFVDRRCVPVDGWDFLLILNWQGEPTPTAARLVEWSDSPNWTAEKAHPAASLLIHYLKGDNQ